MTSPYLHRRVRTLREALEARQQKMRRPMSGAERVAFKRRAETTRKLLEYVERKESE